ncbi:sulfate transporter family protein-like protein [Calycina marina]|uniref:Sulfate transporter family protein-like protein n=1 Tax=Calycina marina TaxID=1763456 RepID=A0A9P7Z3R5_9HELO|nr:sulfate transporter family protein-like protein [Calycina marina]
MSLPSVPARSVQRLRAKSMASHSSPRFIPNSSADSSDGASELIHGSLRGQSESRNSILNPVNASGVREPTRSFLHRSYVGSQAPIDNTLSAFSVRDDTAELASYALSDRASIQSGSPPAKRGQSHLESYFSQLAEGETPLNKDLDRVRQDILQEVSEPASPLAGPLSHSPGASALTDLIRRSPTSTSPPDHHFQASGDEESDNEPDMSQGRLTITSNGVKMDATEQTPLISKQRPHESRHRDWIDGQQDLERQYAKQKPSWPKTRDCLSWPKEKITNVAHIVTYPKEWDREAILQNFVYAPARNFPAAVLGALLNILDALSYGMILFPLGQSVFEKLGPAGISMFYVSCIVSQLVFSLGGSAFHNAIGSEMIEVVPFFHKMAFTIMARVGKDNPASVIATTIVAYQISSVLTGIVFYLQGVLKFGYIVGFIPRHILMGCIGGVGLFLITTGFEVSARLDGNLNYDLATLKTLFQLDIFFHWAIPFALAVILGWLQGIMREGPLKKFLLPGFILSIGAVFYFFVFSINELEIGSMRQTGWIFDGPESGEPWWYFWTLYTGENFKRIHWDAILHTVPAMFALTFFGVLHVPINVPALGFALGHDDLDLDRELKAHGVSNALSGLLGSMQNYLVYSNSVVFIKAGADGRSAGLMLIALTGGLLVTGPVTIGYIPVMMVGCLIFLLGFELFIEAVWDSRHKLNWFEYITVITIVFVMGLYDFVVGIFVGIGFAFVSVTWQMSRIPAVRASYPGDVVQSTVRRNATQSHYLHKAGEQTQVKKLGGYLFFGTIVSAENEIRCLIEEKTFSARPIRYLILDLQHVTGIDYSAAEAFNRLSRVLYKKGVALFLSGVHPGQELHKSLISVGLGQEEIEVKIFGDLNSALENCENEYLRTFYASKEARSNRRTSSAHLDVPNSDHRSILSETQYGSPRVNQLQKSAHFALDQHPAETRYYNLSQPLKLILHTFQSLTPKTEDFWFRALRFFERKQYVHGTVIFHVGEAAGGFYLVEEGILRADYELPQGKYFENIVAGTTCGELPFFSETDRTATVMAERDCVCWLLSRENWKTLQKEESDIAQELLQISLKLTSERMSAITSYVLTTAG